MQDDLLSNIRDMQYCKRATPSLMLFCNNIKAHTPHSQSHLLVTDRELMSLRGNVLTSWMKGEFWRLYEVCMKTYKLAFTTLKCRFQIHLFMCLSVLRACMDMHHKHAWWPQRPEEVIRSLGTGVRDDCEPSCVYRTPSHVLCVSNKCS